MRPVLCLTRDEIEEYLKARGISYVTDSTNLQDIYSRNKIRHGVVPVLKEINPRFSESVMRASENLRKDEACLSGMAEKFIKDNFRNDRVLAEELAALPEAVSSRVIRSVWGNELHLCT